ncbi:PREDICTED: microtubule-actin cross-linking factor 1-like [Pterocles gutturalis]|uniref:microtubule-actin cross-linking factor 1-like n=1 Tax=Pterocles gutturalis TaxID=240206 RepID=UPI000528FDAA|nr:PREDICTED: microtubule-actin cross-linking factor 1-like [Pterocles gutturalis]
MEEINTRWNTLNKKVAQRVAQLQEALLHCGKFQDALEPLLSWLADTEELISNQKPPSAEYKVVKAQIQEQKLLQRLLEDRKATVEMIQAEGESGGRPDRAVGRAGGSGEDHRAAGEPGAALGRAAGPGGRQAEAAGGYLGPGQTVPRNHGARGGLAGGDGEEVGQLRAHRYPDRQDPAADQPPQEEEIESHAAGVSRAVGVGQSLSSLSCAAERRLLAEKLESLRSRYGEVRERCCRKAALLDHYP